MIGAKEDLRLQPQALTSLKATKIVSPRRPTIDHDLTLEKIVQKMPNISQGISE